MKNSQIALLQGQANHYFEQARISIKPRDSLALTEIALQLLAEARKIGETASEHALLHYFEFMVTVKKKFSFETYVEFCIRNGFQSLSREDYNEILSSMR